jgi:NTP pyrophosphatase (non-canonical NTP hydrolase)
MSNNFINEDGMDSASGAAKAAEELNSKAKDRVEDLQDTAESIAENAWKSAEDVANDPKVNAFQTKQKIKERTAAARSTEGGASTEKIEMDLDKYIAFVDQTTSRASQTTADYKERLAELVAAGCNVARLDTAASGLVAESGEFMEIVKKIKFQGKPWDDANKEHLKKELGDIMWYVAQACLALDVRLDEVIYMNTLKLAARYPTGEFTVEHSEHRKQGDI